MTLSLRVRARGEVLDEFVSRVPFASALVPLVYHAAQAATAIGVLLVPQQGDND
jgi:hypothetical protein